MGSSAGRRQRPSGPLRAAGLSSSAPSRLDPLPAERLDEITAVPSGTLVSAGGASLPAERPPCAVLPRRPSRRTSSSDPEPDFHRLLVQGEGLRRWGCLPCSACCALATVALGSSPRAVVGRCPGSALTSWCLGPPWPVGVWMLKAREEAAGSPAGVGVLQAQRRVLSASPGGV